MGSCQGCGPRKDVQHALDLGSAAVQQDPLEDVQVQLTGQASEQDSYWTRLGGTELEEALTNEWVKLVRADWLIERARTGGTLARRQDMPPEAYVGLKELKQAGPAVLTNPNEASGGCAWLRVIVLSHPWLQPGHPDPHGENLRCVAEVLQHFVRDSRDYSNGGKPYGVLIDFTALFQVPRTDEQHNTFLRALPELSVFYSHPNTVVLKVTELPEGYPHHPSFRYELPQGSNTAPYMERGWCFAESAMGGLVKSSDKILDIGRQTRRAHLWQLIDDCRARGTPPLHPDDFKDKLGKKTFASKVEDFEKLARLYSVAFDRRLGGATKLDYRERRWGADAAQQLARALQSSRLLQRLNLGDNRIGDEGAIAIVETLQRHTALRALNLSLCGIGQQGAIVLGQALQRSSALLALELGRNDLGTEGASAFSEALRSNCSLRELGLASCDLGDEGVAALGQVLQVNGTLQSLDLWSNGVGGQGAAALGEALHSNSSLRTLGLGRNHIGDLGAAALGQALQSNRALQSLNLYDNSIGSQGAAALGAALRSNSCLQTLNLKRNKISNDGARALAQALQGNRALQSLDLQGNDFGSEAGDALRRAAGACKIPLQLNV